MLNLLKDMYIRAEDYKGTRLVTLLIIIFVVFLSIGFTINYSIDQFLKSNETEETSLNPANNTKEQTKYSGIVSFVDMRKYPEDRISYLLKDKKGKQIVLLKAKDQKLEVVEGLYVTVTGSLTKTKDQKQKVLIVDEVSVKTSEKENN